MKLQFGSTIITSQHNYPLMSGNGDQSYSGGLLVRSYKTHINERLGTQDPGTARLEEAHQADQMQTIRRLVETNKPFVFLPGMGGEGMGGHDTFQSLVKQHRLAQLLDETKQPH